MFKDRKEFEEWYRSQTLGDITSYGGLGKFAAAMKIKELEIRDLEEREYIEREKNTIEYDRLKNLSVCSTLKRHHKELKNDDQRLSTEFLLKIIKSEKI
jgi:hypothetical protein